MPGVFTRVLWLFQEYFCDIQKAHNCDMETKNLLQADYSLLIYGDARPEGYGSFSMLNQAEHKICSAKNFQLIRAEHEIYLLMNINMPTTVGVLLN